MDDATTMRSSTAQQEGLAGAGFGFDQSIPPGDIAGGTSMVSVNADNSVPPLLPL